MSFELFNTNADICTKMAAATKSPEIRDQWNELAADWRSKANACRPNIPAESSESTKHLEVSLATAPEPPVNRKQATKPEPSVNHPQAKGARALVSKAILADVRLPPRVVPSAMPHD